MLEGVPSCNGCCCAQRQSRLLLASAPAESDPSYKFWRIFTKGRSHIKRDSSLGLLGKGNQAQDADSKLKIDHRPH